MLPHLWRFGSGVGYLRVIKAANQKLKSRAGWPVASTVWLAFLLSDLEDLPRCLIQIHVIELQSLVVTDLNTEGVLNVADGFCSFDDIRRIVRRPHAAHLLGIRILPMRSAMLRINCVKRVVDAGEAVLQRSATETSRRHVRRSLGGGG